MSDRSLVLVVGPGRSGTSSLAGALAHSGFHVPDAIRAKDANPLGFFEPRWAVRFHKTLLEQAGVVTLDPDPAALESVLRVAEETGARGQIRARLEEWFATHDRLVIKDPRAIWFCDAWTQAAADLGVEPGYVVMVRHPSEVSASRGTYYSATDVVAVGGWTNVALLAMEATQGARRALVHYPDLVGDWRPQLSRVADRLGLVLEPAPEVRPHPVDDFVDPSLRRMDRGWDGVAVPTDLRDLAERAFGLMHDLCQAEEPAEAVAGVATVREEYVALYDAARALTRSSTRRRLSAAKRRSARKARRKALAEADSRRLVVRARGSVRRLVGRSASTDR